MPDLSARSEVAGYRIEAVAGRGGMGVVYRATDLTLERPVALKVISDEFAQDAGAAADSGNNRVYRSTPPKLDKDLGGRVPWSAVQGARL